MNPKLTGHRLKEIRIRKMKSGRCRVFIASDEGEFSVDFRSRRLAIRFAKRYLRFLDSPLSVDDYVALKCGPPAAVMVFQASGSRREVEGMVA